MNAQKQHASPNDSEQLAADYCFPEPPPEQKFKFDRLELAGAFGDLGTMLPIVIGMIVLNGLSPTTIFLSIKESSILTFQGCINAKPFRYQNDSMQYFFPDIRKT